MEVRVVALCCLALLSSTQQVQSARILAIFPHIGKSHFFVFEPLMKALVARGHDVHVVSNFPQTSPLANYTDINIRGSVTEMEPTEGVTFDMLLGGPSRFTIAISGVMLGHLGTTTCEAVLAFPSITRLLHSNETFDLVITELFNADCFLGFVHKFQAPNVAISSCVLMPWASDRFGNPNNPSYIPVSMVPFSDRMTFADRVENSVFYFLLRVVHYVMFSWPQQTIAAKYFGDDMPSLDALARNTSLILVNSHPSLNRARPLVPAIIDVGGLHVSELKKLPEDLDRWISDAPDGVIFFSMGSMLRTDSLPPEKISAFLQAFSELPQRVLWKFESESLPNQPANVRIQKWLPQRDILAHHNVRLLITHCGLLGTVEAIISGVPIVGMPMFGDQHSNYKAIEAAGIAVRLDYAQISKEAILTTVHKVLGNSSYRENAKRLAIEYTDRPLSAMETAIFWTEYVIRHKGAHHLRSAAVDLPWYQYLLLDVALLFFAILLALAISLYYFIKMLIGLCRNKRCIKPKQQ